MQCGCGVLWKVKIKDNKMDKKIFFLGTDSLDLNCYHC